MPNFGFFPLSLISLSFRLRFFIFFGPLRVFCAFANPIWLLFRHSFFGFVYNFLSLSIPLLMDRRDYHHRPAHLVRISLSNSSFFTFFNHNSLSVFPIRISPIVIFKHHALFHRTVFMFMAKCMAPLSQNLFFFLWGVASRVINCRCGLIFFKFSWLWCLICL